MRVFVSSLVASAMVAAFAVEAPIAAPTAEAAKVRAVLLTQAKLFKQARWRAMYQTYTQRFRARCPYSRFVRIQSESRDFLGTRFSIRDIRVRVTGARALVAYRFVSETGRVLAQVRFADGDAYARVGGRWFDDLDRVSSC